MTDTQPELGYEPREPTPEEIDAYWARRFTSYEELLEEWFALFGVRTKVRRSGPTFRAGASG